VLQAHEKGKSCRAARFTLDGRSVVCGGEDRKLAMLDLETHKPVRVSVMRATLAQT